MDAVMGNTLTGKGYYLSQSNIFMKAYQKDIARFSNDDKKIWHDLIQPEVFADAFASLYGGGCCKVTPFRKAFPHTIACVEQTVQDFETQRAATQHQKLDIVA